MLIKLFLAFILIPLIELFLLIWIAGKITPLPTIALVIVTGVIGSILARRQGLQTLYRFRQATAEGRLPGREIQEGLLIGLAAILLLTPGVLSDTVGFLLLVPAVREIVRRALVRRLTGSIRMQIARGPMSSAGPAARSEMDPASMSPRRARPDTIDAINVRPTSPR